MDKEQQKPSDSAGEPQGKASERAGVSGEGAGDKALEDAPDSAPGGAAGDERESGSGREGGNPEREGSGREGGRGAREGSASGRTGAREGGGRQGGGGGRPGAAGQREGGRGGYREGGGGNREGGGGRDGARQHSRGGQQQQRPQQRPQTPRVALVSGKLVELFRAGDESAQDLIQLAHDFASQTGHVKHHQLRNLLDLVIWAKQSHHQGKDAVLEAPVRGRLACLRPRVAYMAARERGLLSLRDELDLLLKDKEAFTCGADLDRLYSFVAAVVAYHKFEEVTREHQRSK